MHTIDVHRPRKYRELERRSQSMISQQHEEYNVAYEKSARQYGNHVQVTNYGELLLAEDGDGDLYDELSTEVDSRHYGRLTEIMIMQSEMNQTTLPGDERICELLEFERVLLEAGEEMDCESVVDTYPDLPDYIHSVVIEKPAVVAALTQIVGDEEGVRWFSEAPAEYLAQISQTQALDILHMLQDNSFEEQEKVLLDRRTSTELAHVALAA